MNYYISDLHFGHANVIRFDGRPFADVTEMDRVMIERWNEAVNDDDDVYIVGDFCYRAERPADWYLVQLKGHKHLVIGNHDWPTIQDEKAMALFDTVNSVRLIEDCGRKIVLCHYPMAEWCGSRKTAWHVYGHVHNRRNKTYEFMRTIDRTLNAGAPIVDYRPVSFQELVRYNQCFNDETNGEVWFSSRSPRFREFSNFYPSPFMLDGETWSCVEQYYQCAKFERGTEPYNRIRAQERPGGMKGLATHHAAEIRADWDCVKVGVMERAVRAKFDQNPQLLELYAQVSQLTLIHESKTDCFWGTNRTRQGDNRLGTLIKVVCDELIRLK